MVAYLLKQKIKKEAKKPSKKTLICAGSIALGVGAYFAYKSMKNKCCNNGCGCELDEDYNYEYEVYQNQKEKKERDDLEQKIYEFNSNRITSENTPHVSKEELEDYVNKSEEYKEKSQKEITINDEQEENKFDIN